MPNATLAITASADIIHTALVCAPARIRLGVESENDSWATSGTKIRIENASKGITLFNYQSMI